MREEVLGRQWGKLTLFQLRGLNSLQMQLKLIFAERNKKDKCDDACHLRRPSDTFRWSIKNLILNHSILAVVYNNARWGKTGKWFTYIGSLFSWYIALYFPKRNNFYFQSYLFHEASHEHCWPPSTGKSCCFSNPHVLLWWFCLWHIGESGTSHKSLTLILEEIHHLLCCFYKTMQVGSRMFVVLFSS